MEATAVATPKRTIIEEFVYGAKNGMYLGLERIVPAMIMAYVLILILRLTGLMTIIGTAVAPIMALFGLPGEAVICLVSAFFAKAAGCATAATLYADGVITAGQATILFPACITMGTLVGHFVRCVVASGTNAKHHALMVAIPIVDALLSMLLIRGLLLVMGIE